MSDNWQDLQKKKKPSSQQEYADLFRQATQLDADPFPYQQRLAEEDWPCLLNVPTGLGKTAAVTLAWIYKRLNNDLHTPRRLIWCLPMRVLVEQTARNIRSWLKELGLGGAEGEGRIAVHVMMGGEPDIRKGDWVMYPDEQAILVGTQDMLLSRALMRGYGMSRYQWPIHFGFLHTDALWVFDEVQLMGPALSTSAQLEAFRRSDPTGSTPARSLWVSATLRPDWLATVDFRAHLNGLRVAELEQDDLACAPVRVRRDAVKTLTPATSKLDADSSKANAKVYIEGLASEVTQAHVPGSQTIVILNTVERAQALFRALGKKPMDAERLLLHARFRPAERRNLEAAIAESPPVAGRIVIATQAIEAGVDITSMTLFTELAPWASLVQRFGRCNRYGECDERNPAAIRWIEIASEKALLPPYESSALDDARAKLIGLRSASSGELPPQDAATGVTQVLRRKDFLELFNTEADLSGFDVDVSQYIRDTGSPQCQVFWRTGPQSDEHAADRSELCPVGIVQLKRFLDAKSGHRVARVWDGLSGRWQNLGSSQLRPGLTVLLDAADGGYLPDEGFVANSKLAVEPVQTGVTTSDNEVYSSDSLTTIGRWVGLTEHLSDVATEAGSLARALDLSETDVAIVTRAGQWHDVGKAHEAFQTALRDHGPPDPTTLWAKSAGGRGRLQYRLEEQSPRPCFRHELASMLAWLEHGEAGENHDLIAYLIAAHHGRIRFGLRSLPTEKEPPDDRLYARGVWAGDELPAVALNGVSVPAVTIKLDLMKLGDGAQGASWTARAQGVLAKHGPVRLAWLESLVRIADWRASRNEQLQTPPKEEAND